MKEYYSVLSNSALFKDIAPENLEGALSCAGAFLKTFPKNASICNFGDKIDKVGIVVSGACHVERVDISGNRIILLEVTEGKSFGEAISFSGMQISPISVIASTNCSIVFVPVKKVVESLDRVCGYSMKLVENLIKLLGQKCLALHIKTDILSQKTTRQKLMSYFEYESEAAHSKSFFIPFKREELADYLSVNRSAMTRELFAMRAEGIIDFDGNAFKILT